ARELRQVFLLLLFRAEIYDGQDADADMRPPADTEAAAHGNMVSDDARGYLVHVRAAVLFGNIDVGEAKFTRLLDQIAADLPVLVLDLLDIGQDLIAGKLVGGLRDLPMLVSKVFWREDFFDVTLFDEKASACDLGL